MVHAMSIVLSRLQMERDHSKAQVQLLQGMTNAERMEEQERSDVNAMAAKVPMRCRKDIEEMDELLSGSRAVS